ncbi:hypothetical protein DAI22_05g068100 [Oryza sativa Japonica Group]|nr:hypothetical protein DAI22_05g068100 [Oryza sativa Japonica Group]
MAPAAAASVSAAADAAAASYTTPRNILITGAAGFIASHVANRLLRDHPSYRVVALDKLDDYCATLNNLAPAMASPNFAFVRGDVASADLVLHLLLAERINTVMHFAAHTHVDDNSFEFTKNNVLGTHVLLEPCRRKAPPAPSAASSTTDEVYGDAATAGNHEASRARLLPTNQSFKERLLRPPGDHHARQQRVRPAPVPGEARPQAHPPRHARRQASSPSTATYGSRHARSYLYCDDVAEAFDVVLHRGRVIDVARHVCGVFGLDPGEAVATKLKALGWSERTPWEEGIKKTAEWYVEHGAEWWGDVDVSAALLPHPRILTPQQSFDTTAMTNFDFK